MAMRKKRQRNRSGQDRRTERHCRA